MLVTCEVLGLDCSTKNPVSIKIYSTWTSEAVQVEFDNNEKHIEVNAEELINAIKKAKIKED